MRSPLARRPGTIQTKKERIKQAQAREFNRRCTLANELDFPDAENFFSQEEFVEKEPSFIQEYSDENISPNQTPRQRTNTIDEQMRHDMNSLDGSGYENNTSSFLRKRLIGKFHYNRGKSRFGQKKKPEKAKIDMSLMNEQEFSKYLLKKYGQQKGVKRYDSMLFNKKKMSISVLKQRSNNITQQNSMNTSMIGLSNDVSPLLRPAYKEGGLVKPETNQVFNIPER